MFIPPPRLTATFRLDEILFSLHQEDETAAWTMAFASLSDFLSIQNGVLKFHCHDKAVARKLGGTADRKSLREIYFPGFSDPVYVQHTQRVYNKVTPPSIGAKKAATEAAKGFQPSKNTIRHIELSQSRPATGIIPAPEALLACPTAKDSFSTWSQVSKQINCRAPPPLHQGKVVDIVACTEEEKAFFELHITRTGYQLAFSPLEDDESHDITCAMTVEDSCVVCSNPLYPRDPVARMLEEQCLHTDPRKPLNKAHRRSHIAATQVAFTELKDPETRLAAIASYHYLASISDSLCRPTYHCS
ncbi:hypothetical protein ABG067_007345 [Albugo candida]